MREKIPLLDIFERLDEKQRRILIGAVIFLLVFLICYNLIYKNAAKRVIYYKSRLKKLTTQNRLRGELSRLDGIKRAYETLIAQKQNIDSFKNELSKLALSSGGKVMSIVSVRKPGPADYNAFSTTLELRCSYHQLGNFLSIIENAEPYIGIKNIKLGTEVARTMSPMELAAAKPLPEGDTVTDVSLVLETYSLRR
ncbi:MAG: hypothetical protein JSW18_04710 [Candidatus Omnitrophota bacterium]|nr:MAG: hypothetical protein JSW18_04710 [Candidatus Omnitrophota bacterium]